MYYPSFKEQESIVQIHMNDIHNKKIPVSSAYIGKDGTSV